jgi:hypothetical protein
MRVFALPSEKIDFIHCGTKRCTVSKLAGVVLLPLAAGPAPPRLSWEAPARRYFRVLHGY